MNNFLSSLNPFAGGVANGEDERIRLQDDEHVADDGELLLSLMARRQTGPF